MNNNYIIIKCTLILNLNVMANNTDNIAKKRAPFQLPLLHKINCDSIIIIMHKKYFTTEKTINLMILISVLSAERLKIRFAILCMK